MDNNQTKSKPIKLLTWGILGVIVLILVSIAMQASPKQQSAPDSVSKGQREQVYAQFTTDCKKAGGEDSYCGCVANNLSSWLTKDSLAALEKLDTATKEEASAFIEPYTKGCV